MPVISVPKRLRQKHCKFEASLGYIATSYLRNKQKKQNKK
jgi:hypothetical protein